MGLHQCPSERKGEGVPVLSLRVPSHVPSNPQTAAKVRGFSVTASGFTAETDWLLEGGGFELPVPLATERLSCRLDALGGVLFGELGFGLTNHQDREGDGCQHTEAEQHPVEKAGPVS